MAHAMAVYINANTKEGTPPLGWWDLSGDECIPMSPLIPAEMKDSIAKINAERKARKAKAARLMRRTFSAQVAHQSKGAARGRKSKSRQGAD